jgi:hypothetical protein
MRHLPSIETINPGIITRPLSYNNTNTHSLTLTFMHIYSHNIHTHAHTHIYTITLTLTFTQSHSHSHLHNHTHTHIYTITLTHTHTHSLTCTHSHTYTITLSHYHTHTLTLTHSLTHSLTSIPALETCSGSHMHLLAHGPRTARTSHSPTPPAGPCSMDTTCHQCVSKYLSDHPAVAVTSLRYSLAHSLGHSLDHSLGHCMLPLPYLPCSPLCLPPFLLLLRHTWPCSKLLFHSLLGGT